MNDAKKQTRTSRTFAAGRAIVEITQYVMISIPCLQEKSTRSSLPSASKRSFEKDLEIYVVHLETGTEHGILMATGTREPHTLFLRKK